MHTDVVLGAGSGMGAAVAARLSRGDRRLLLADIDLGAAEATAREVGGGAEAVRCDLTSVDDVTALAASIGELGAFVMTAGLSPTMASGERIYEVDLVAPARLLPILEPTLGSESVGVLFASMAGHMVPPSAEIDPLLDEPLDPGFLAALRAAGLPPDDPTLAYAIAKRGLIRLTRRTSVAWAARGARLLSVSPGIIDTPMGRAELAEQSMMAGMIEATQLGRLITADEIADVVAFLVGPAARAITGTDVLVDSGGVAALIGPT
ncbi:MAG: SDR family oxidoreductase [Actinomycetota bacterium]|nr:SDR family oxidoreductase [Actinomycetota bacterium]